MKFTYQSAKFAFTLLLLLASVFGLMLVLVLLTAWETGQNIFSIGEIMGDRLAPFVKSWYIIADGSASRPESFYLAKARVYGVYFAGAVSSIMSISMLIAGVQPPIVNITEPTDEQVKEYANKYGFTEEAAREVLREKFKGYGDEDKGGSEMNMTTKIVGVISFLISTVGFALFLTKGKTINELMNINTGVQLFLTTSLSFFSPYLLANFSFYMRKKYGAQIDAWINGVQEEMMDSITAETSGMSKEEGKEYVNTQKRQRRANREPKTRNLDDFRNRFGKLGS